MTKIQQFMVDYANLDYQETNGGEIACSCPFCGEKRKKLYISPQGRFICFVCDTRGNSAISFIMQYGQVSVKEAQQVLDEQEINVDTPDFVNYDDEDDSLFFKLSNLNNSQSAIVKKHCPVYPKGMKFLKDNLNNPETFPYLWYLKNRGLNLAEIIGYNIGYIVDGYLTNNGKNVEIKHSVVFTTYNQQHEPVYWNTRSIDYHPYIKSINALSKTDEYSKSDIIFNMDQVTSDSIMVICEGVFNAITCTQGDYVGIATFGKAITNDQIDLMLKLNPSQFIIFLDNDAEKESRHLYQKLSQQTTKPVRIVNNPYGNQDANDLGKARVVELLDHAETSGLLWWIRKGELS